MYSVQFKKGAPPAVLVLNAPYLPFDIVIGLPKLPGNCRTDYCIDPTVCQPDHKPYCIKPDTFLHHLAERDAQEGWRTDHRKRRIKGRIKLPHEFQPQENEG